MHRTEKVRALRCDGTLAADLQIRQHVLKAFGAHVGNLRVLNRQGAEPVQSPEVYQAAIANVGVEQGQRLEVGQPFQVAQPSIGDLRAVDTLLGNSFAVRKYSMIRIKRQGSLADLIGWFLLALNTNHQWRQPVDNLSRNRARQAAFPQGVVPKSSVKHYLSRWCRSYRHGYQHLSGGPARSIVPG